MGTAAVTASWASSSWRASANRLGGFLAAPAPGLRARGRNGGGSREAWERPPSPLHGLPAVGEPRPTGSHRWSLPAGAKRRPVPARTDTRALRRKWLRSAEIGRFRRIEAIFDAV